jgi:hypothetical protein
VRALDLVERHLVRPSSFLKDDSAVLDSRDPAGERALTVDRRRGDDLRQPSREAAEIGLVPQRPIQPRRRDFERVRVAQRLLSEFLFDVEQRAQVLADALALLDADAVFRPFDAAQVRPIDHHPQHHPNRFTPELDVEDFQPVAVRHPFGGLPQSADRARLWRTEYP